MPQSFAPPDGCARTATPAKPTPTPASAGHGSRSRPTRRSTTTQSGTEAMISEASPVGTLRSAKNRTAFAPGSKAPIRMHESERPPRDAQRAAAQPDDAEHQRPAVMKRVEAANSGGIVSPAYAIPRYVDPQIT